MDNQNNDVTQPEITKQILRNPPPNHNPLIGLLHDDTLINVYYSLSTLQELTVSPPNGELNLCGSSSTGLYFLLCCIRDALRFEIDHRDNLELASNTD